MRNLQSVQELVRLDLVHRERNGLGTYAYHGNEAILDAYDDALDLVVYLRQAIEELTIAPPAPKAAAGLEPHHRAARSHAEDECGWFCTHPRDRGPCHVR